MILGAGYHDAADMWSLACMVFELVTGDFLFHPKSEGAYSKDEDHLAQVCRLVCCVVGRAGVTAGAEAAEGPGCRCHQGRQQLRPWTVARLWLLAACECDKVLLKERPRPTCFTLMGPCFLSPLVWVQMMELMGEMPVRIATHGKHAPRFFDDAGRLRHIAELHPWPLDRVLAEKYGLPVEEVRVELGAESWHRSWVGRGVGAGPLWSEGAVPKLNGAESLPCDHVRPPFSCRCAGGGAAGLFGAHAVL